MPVSRDNLAEALAAIERAYPGSAHTGDKSPEVSRIPTGSLELDWATGGGIPIGRWVHFWGAYSSGKSLTCWNVAREAIALGQDVAYYNIERQFDPKFVRSLGINPKKILVVDGTTIEETGKKLEALMGSVHLHLIDSLKAAISVDELSAKLEEWQRAIAARAWGKALRRVHERFDYTENTVIMVNHAAVQMNTGGETPPGGRLIDHLSSMTIHFKRGKWMYHDTLGNLVPEDRDGNQAPSGDHEPDGFEIQARVTKSRVSQPLRPARMRYDFHTRRFDAAFEYAKAARHTDVVKQTSPGRFELPDGTKVHGIPRLRDVLKGNVDIQESIRVALMNGGNQ